MKKITLTMLLALTAVIAFCQPSSDAERNKGWQTDIDTMLSLMKQQHYVYKTKPFPPELLVKAKALKENIANYGDERMGLELEKLMYYMHDGHSYVLPIFTKKPPVYYMPIQFYIFNDGVYIIDADEPYKRLIGYKVLKLNGAPAEKVIDDMNGYVHQDNAYTVKWFAPTMMRFRAVYETYGLAPLSKNIVLSVVDRNNKPATETIEFIPSTNFRSIPKLIPSQLPGAPPAPAWLSKVPVNYWIEKHPEKSMLYFQFNQVLDAQDEPMAAFSKRLDDSLTSLNPKLFIIDVRNNNGGNYTLLTPLMDVIKKYETSHKDGKIVVITGRNTFSAAQIFITMVNRDTHALFAGEPSGSSPNFVGEDGNIFTLPYSGAMGNISYRYHETIPGDSRKWIKPDYEVTLSSKQYFDNRDPVMEYLSKKFN